MFCAKCHAEVPLDAAFCPKCGSAVAGAAAGGTRAVTPTERMQGAQVAAPQEPEHELWRGGYSAKALYGGWTFAALVTVAAAVLAAFAYNPIALIAAGIAVLLVWLVLAIKFIQNRYGTWYTLTNQRFLHQKGLFSQLHNRILLIDIDDVSFEQGLMERFLNVGTITLTSTDATNPKLTMPGIADVQRVANLIDDARREERRKRAIYLANA
jgi:membrane protein YdbS with pleckstrin-like domain